MKKALYLTMVMALILASAFTFSACRQTENSNGSNDEPPTNTAVGIADISQSEVEIKEVVRTKNHRGFTLWICAYAPRCRKMVGSWFVYRGSDNGSYA